MLLAAMRDFDLTYAAYAEFQRGMERYWCLRWLLQASRTSVTARVLKDELVRVDEIPLVLRIPSLPSLVIAPRGAHVQISIDGIDLLEAQIRARFVELLSTQADVVEDLADEEIAGEIASTAAAETAKLVQIGSAQENELPAETRSVTALEAEGDAPPAE
jgi:exoribonuclease-2